MTEQNLEQAAQVKLGADDAEAIRLFCEAFKVPCPPELSAAIDQFKAEPNLVNQNRIKLQLIKWLETSEHPAMKHALFNIPRERGAQQAPALEFDELLRQKLEE